MPDEQSAMHGFKLVFRRFVAGVLPLLVLVGVAVAEGPAYVWWEGERVASTNFPAESPFSASTFPFKRNILSSGNWLTNAGLRTGGEAFARYVVNVAAGGKYDLWCRKFWKHGPFRWKFDHEQWTICPSDVALADSATIRTHLGANWVHLGQVRLESGAHEFELRLLAEKGESLTAAFDCFILIQGLFIPRGKLKPEDPEDKSDTGYFPWAIEADRFASSALLDLRGLNEKTAGISGFVKRKGRRFVLGNGRSVRFWAVNAGGDIAGLDRASVDYLARRLAKVGVNMVRYHGPVFDTDPEKVSAKKLDNLFYFVAALKKRGIYTNLSFYFPLWFDIKPGYGVPGFDEAENKIPFALIYFDKRMRSLHRGWLRGLFTTKNPYTGLTLAREPAIAITELVNEDSLFFWTFGRKNIPDVQWRKLENRYGRWLKSRYGSMSKVRRKWLEAREEGDDPKRGRFALYDAWHMTRDGMKSAGPGKVQRVRDQVRFLASVQRGFYESTIRYMRETLKVRCLISPGNWTTADPEILDAIERYTYTVGDVIDYHGYFEGGGHDGEGASYSVRAGHDFKNLPAVKVPEKLPLRIVQVEGYPATISEIGWTNPNMYRADFAFLAAAYGALQGIDGIYTFAVGSASWDRSMKKFALSSPVILGNFPAYALLYRRGDVKEAPASIRQALSMRDLFSLKVAGGAKQAYDKLRRKDVPASAAGGRGRGAIDPLAFYTGPVVRAFWAKKSATTRRDLGKMINREWKSIRSATGELAWDYGRGIVRLDTPRSQGAAGFLSQMGEIKLGRVTIASENDFSSVMVTSLDGKRIELSRNILIQVMTIERPLGFKAAGGDDGRIVNLGGPPFGVKKIHAMISLDLESGDEPVVRALDEHGYPKGPKLPLRTEDGRIVIQLREDAVYHVLKR